ncbi:sulfotransferase [candidate division CSSED10-310 bacterium]|uniref:Sulfotransferase n=1 Tax=candidate division CSSED10-310 bacterium TaxID=2855610 RepID=A0ABV6Z521_UNCC1
MREIKVHFIIIGAMKCATTTLREQLAQQDGIYMLGKPKESHFFSYDIHYAKGISWYKAKFKNAAENDICGEATTSYSKFPQYPDSAARIKQHYPDIKLVYVMRHPVDRLISQYIHEVTQREIPDHMSIDQAIKKYPRLVHYSCYTKQLEVYFAQFEKQSILPVFFERLCADSQKELERICSFLNCPKPAHWDYNIEPQNVSKNLLMKSHFVDFIIDNQTFRSIRQKVVPHVIPKKIRRLFEANIEKPTISKTQMNYLKEVFDQDLKKLGLLLGVELTCDSYRQIVSQTVREWVLS